MGKKHIEFRVGDTVRWTGKANGSAKEHEGKITMLRVAEYHMAQPFYQAVVCVSSVNKRTGKPNADKTYEPRLSSLTRVKKAEAGAVEIVRELGNGVTVFTTNGDAGTVVAVRIERKS